MIEPISILVFVAALTVLLTAGWVLFLFFWARGVARGTRSFAAALLGSAGLMVPILVLGGEGFLGGEDITVMPVIVPLLAGIVGLPSAILANRRLERIGSETASIFE